MTPRLRKKLTAEERATFFRLSRACAERDNLKRLTARLRLNAFVIKHGKEACQVAWDALMAKRKRRDGR